MITRGKRKNGDKLTLSTKLPTDESKNLKSPFLRSGITNEGIKTGIE
jgi:hypothetical protein